MRPFTASCTWFGTLVLLATLGGCQGQPATAASELNAAEIDTATTSCSQRHPGVTGIHATISVDQYRGVHSGRSGKHEIVEGTITNVIWAYESSLVDTNNVEVAMNVASGRDPSGLPHEIQLSPGDSFEVQGEYIPADQANADNDNGAAAVIHFTHAPCGFAVLDGTTYQ